jgi:2-amino-4-hydroxy-6-hydroxymethyldihydropteridine diphosphokinase
MSTAVIGVGANLGSREASIRAAARLLDARPDVAVVDRSPMYETAPLGPEQPDYLNAAFRVETALAPAELLKVLLRTERRLGRVRRAGVRWGPRSMDLDLLWDERGPVDIEGLSVPHPGLVERAFALGPLLAVMPELDSSYGAALAGIGGSPPVFDRAASLVDASAESVGTSSPAGRPWATVHRDVAATRQGLVDAAADLYEHGFSVHCASVSHCLDTQWRAHFHGVNLGARGAPVWASGLHCQSRLAAKEQFGSTRRC